MKKRPFYSAVAAVVGIVLLSVGAFAANDPTHDPNIVARFERQQMRIDQGVKSGTLTKDEAALVQDNLNRIKAEEAKLKAAGQLTPKAKESLNKKLDLNSKMIDSQKKNAIKRID
jgi:hypothetical protein